MWLLHAEVIPSQHGLSDQMEEAVKGWFSTGPHDNVNYEVNLMTAQGPLGTASSPHEPCCMLNVVDLQNQLV